MTEPAFMAFAIFSSLSVCEEFVEYYDLERIFEPQCVQMGGAPEYQRPIPNIRPMPRPEVSND
jgi:hypothetical protein|tara:strand:- start:157 stop:345 length:189 start_codon:yes stop_codon:yes gene_type:complete